MLPPSRTPGAASEDSAVRSTDSDALLSRVSATRQGYLDDPFCLLFLTPSQRRSTERRPPLINIGTHARTWAVDELVEQFLRSGEVNSKERPLQVLSLGAGTDTRYWRMRKRWSERKGEESWPVRKWVEVDFAEATSIKARTIATKSELRDQLGGDVKIEQGGLGLSSPLYAILPGDLRDVPSLSLSLFLSQGGAPPHLDPSLPTLLLLECVLVYLTPEKTNDLLKFFTSTFKEGCVVAYDPFGLDDSFGEVMKRNLAMRGLSLPGSRSTPTLDSLSRRLESNGFLGSGNSLSIKQIRESIIPRDDLERVNKIEQIDEVEELNLVLDHYAISWSHVSGASSDSLRIGLQSR
ncbi:leucine carboxy methyltransferase [Sporobolomyces salmoneus]|uniref:leucine carboxy methyltransferase n=1 Tax=Sporobolomyces salmoneus TaxID=183962 RepID=UPI00316BB31C